MLERLIDGVASLGSDVGPDGRGGRRVRGSRAFPANVTADG